MTAPIHMVRSTEILADNEYLESFFGTLPPDLAASDEGEEIPLDPDDIAWLVAQHRVVKA